MENLVQKLQEWGAQFGINLLAAILILVIGLQIAKFISQIIKKIMNKSRIDPLLVSFVGNISYYAAVAFVIIAALSRLGIQTASFVAVLGAAGLAVGLALQGSLSNFAAGVLMIIFRPFNVGNYIEGAGVAGIVEEIQLFTTVIKTFDNKTIIIPNAKLAGDNIVNHSSAPYRMVELIFNVSYQENIDHVKQVIADVFAQEPKILKNPEPLIAVLELGAIGVKIIVRPACLEKDYWEVLFNINEKIKNRFDAEGISPAVPKHNINLLGNNGDGQKLITQS